MAMVSREAVQDWAARLFTEARDFSTHPDPVKAQNILMLAECVSAAATGYLIKHKMEGIIDGARKE